MITKNSYDHLYMIAKNSYDHLYMITKNSYDHLYMIAKNSYDHLYMITKNSYDHLYLMEVNHSFNENDMVYYIYYWHLQFINDVIILFIEALAPSRESEPSWICVMCPYGYRFCLLLGIVSIVRYILLAILSLKLGARDSMKSIITSFMNCKCQ
jgi:hypothetical protein